MGTIKSTLTWSPMKLTSIVEILINDIFPWRKISSKGISMWSLVSLCKKASESTMHCLVKCGMVTSTWFTFLMILRPLNENNISFVEWVKYWCDMKNLSKHELCDILNIIGLFAWKIWKYWCIVVFYKVEFNFIKVCFASYRILDEVQVDNSFPLVPEKANSFQKLLASL